MLDLQKYFGELVDPVYRKFNTRIVNTSMPIYGVRMPALRDAARMICREGSAEEFLRSGKFDIYELSMVRGLVIAMEAARRDFAWIERQLADFVPSIENWAVCDCFCGEFKTAMKHREALLPFIEAMIATGREFEVRTGVILLMNYYLDDQYIDYSLATFARVGSLPGDYYVMMGVAWAVSVAFVKQRDRALALLASCALNPTTQNKAISKIRESFRVTPADKELVKTYKLLALRAVTSDGLQVTWGWCIYTLASRHSSLVTRHSSQRSPTSQVPAQSALAPRPLSLVTRHSAVTRPLSPVPRPSAKKARLRSRAFLFYGRNDPRSKYPKSEAQSRR